MTTEKTAMPKRKILFEIKNGLDKDFEDLELNTKGHKVGLKACQFWRDVIQNNPVNIDSLDITYIQLTRDFISIQNNSGYETLKSRGLEIIKNDTLRSKIIALYEYEYSILKKLEEEYEEMQFHKNYYKEINEILAPYLVFDNQGKLMDLNRPVQLSVADKNKLLSHFMKIEFNRNMILALYQKTELVLLNLKNQIESTLKEYEK